MKFVEQKVKLFEPISEAELYRSIEQAGRVCYRSPNSGTAYESGLFIGKLIKRGHHSVLEHGHISVEWITDRGVLAEITRHRVGIALSVESTRYVKYDKPDSFKVIKPVGFNEWETLTQVCWLKAMVTAEKAYNELLKSGRSPQEARSVLPQAFATKIRMTANVREWRHILALRTSKAAHPQIREIAGQTLNLFKTKYFMLFEDINYGEDK
jgi:thymidylate synthase (FAD)